MKQLKVGVKIYVLLGLALLMMTGVGITGLTLINRLSSGLTGFYEEEYRSVENMNQLMINNRVIEVYMLEMILSKDPKVHEQMKANILDRIKKNDQALAELGAMSHSEAVKESLKQYQGLIPEYRAARGKVEELAFANKSQEAYAMFTQTFSVNRDKMNEIMARMMGDDQMEAQATYLEAKEAAEAASRLILFIMAAALVLCGLFGWRVTRLVVRPVRHIQSLMEQAEAGDLTVRGSYDSKDELGLLTGSFNRMIGGLRELVSKINDTALTLSASSEELTASAEQTSRASEHIATATGEMAVGFEQQVKSVGEISESMDTMDSNLNRMAHSGEEVIGVSRNAGDLVGTGVQTVESILGQMEDITDSVKEVQRIIDVLSSQSEQIGDIVTAINEIANQTNLLALNASIEAARAGESGRGFSVVANEIRKLSDATSRSSGEISEIIGRVQGEVVQAVGAMERGAVRVQQGMERSLQASEVFTAIRTAVGSVTVKVAEVGQSIAETTEQSQRIVAAMHHISSISEQGAASIQETSASSQQQLATMVEVAASARSLSALAEELQQSLQKFRL